VLVIAFWFLCITIDSQYQKIYIFFAHKQMTEELERQERNAAKKNAQEMRHMIANVAHDLKTVSESLSLFSIIIFK
jgi:signal transduction histidine kinase